MRVRHAFTGLVYESFGDDGVRVEDPRTGRFGIFTPEGEWTSGDVTDADIHMCRAVGGPHAAQPGLAARGMAVADSGDDASETRGAGATRD